MNFQEYLGTSTRGTTETQVEREKRQEQKLKKDQEGKTLQLK